MTERSLEGGDGSSRKKPPDQAEQPEARMQGLTASAGQHDAAPEKSASSRQFRDSQAGTLDEATMFKRPDHDYSGRPPADRATQGTGRGFFSPLRNALLGDQSQVPLAFMRFGSVSGRNNLDTRAEQLSSRQFRDSQAGTLDEAATFRRPVQGDAAQPPKDNASQNTSKSFFSQLRDRLQGDRSQEPLTFMRFGSGRDTGDSRHAETGSHSEKKPYDNPFHRETRVGHDMPQPENAAILPTESGGNLEREHDARAGDAAVDSRAPVPERTSASGIGSPLLPGDQAEGTIRRSDTVGPGSSQGPADRGTATDRGTNADDRQNPASAAVLDAATEAGRWATDLNDDELLAAIIDRDEILSGESNPVVSAERNALRYEQFTRDLMRRAEQAQTPAERIKNWAEEASDTELSRAIAQTGAEHGLAPSSNTEADLTVLESVRDARTTAWAQQIADSLIRVPREPADAEPESAGQDAMTVTQADEPSRSDDAVALLNQAREGIDKVEKWSERGELLLDGRAGKWMGQLHEETKKWNDIINKADQLENAELIYDATVSFTKFARVDPSNPEALAKAAGAAFADFGRLMEKTKTPGLTHMGQLLRGTAHLFEFGREALDPIQRPILQRHPDMRKAIDLHGTRKDP